MKCPFCGHTMASICVQLGLGDGSTLNTCSKCQRKYIDNPRIKPE